MASNTVTAASVTAENQQINKKHPISIQAGRKEGRAQPRDVAGSDLSRIAAQVWQQSLCEHRNADNDAWPKVATIARTECRFSIRTAQRALAELQNKGWIRTPLGDAGGSRKGSLYHLHPDGATCERCHRSQGLKQRGTDTRSRVPECQRVIERWRGAKTDADGCQRRAGEVLKTTSHIRKEPPLFGSLF